MQWLINIITELFTNRHRYFDRGDPAVPDFLIGDLVVNAGWQDMDLSAIVPANAVCVLLRITIRGNNIANRYQLRTKGNANFPNMAVNRLMVANVLHSYDKFVACDSDRFISYEVAGVGLNLINTVVAGWWLE